MQALQLPGRDHCPGGQQKAGWRSLPQQECLAPPVRSTVLRKRSQRTGSCWNPALYRKEESLPSHCLSRLGVAPGVRLCCLRSASSPILQRWRATESARPAASRRKTAKALPAPQLPVMLHHAVRTSERAGAAQTGSAPARPTRTASLPLDALWRTSGHSPGVQTR
jgi:hypothetical protein